MIAENSNHPLVVYFFRAHACSYCETASAYLRQMQLNYPTLEIRDFDVYLDPDARILYSQVLDHLGRKPLGMPTIIIGRYVWVGFQDHYQQEIINALDICRAEGCPDILEEMQAEINTPREEDTSQSLSTSVIVPIFGEVSIQSMPIIVSTMIIGFMDGFNPCSVWVLTVLLSLTLYMQSRPKIFIVGLTFILISALIYALFISGLFTALSYLNYHTHIQILVSIVALIFALINIKDYFFYKQGPSLSISSKAKPGLFQRMRQLIYMEKSGIALVFGTMILSAGVSLLEFSCTAGFPIMWVNLLTNQHMIGSQFIFLLLLYLLIYMLDEIAIFCLIVVSMRAVKLSEHQGRFLKLLSGLIMLALALVMLIQPALMNNLSYVLLVFSAVIAVAFLVDRVHRHIMS